MPRSAHPRHPPHPVYETTDTPPNDHTIRGQSALWFDGHPSRQLHSFGDSPLGIGSERTDFYRANEAGGQRAAQSSAASSEGSSTTVNPPSCSLVSAYGPSCTRRFPSSIRRVVPV